MLVGPEPPWRGGVAAHSAGLRGALTVAGHEATTVSYSRCYPDWLMRSLGRGRLRPESDSAVLDSLNPASWARARALVRQCDPELVVAQWWHPITAPALAAVLGPKAGPGRPVTVLLCHNALAHEIFPLQTSLARMGLRCGDALLAHSRAVAEQLRGLVAPLRPPIEICPMPLLLADGAALTERAQWRAASGFGPDERVAVFVGHGRPYKGLDLLLRAWAEAGLGEHTRLVVAGEILAGPATRRRLSRSARAVSVELRDRYLADDELAGLLVAADLLVLPYRRASQSGIVPMAQALGLPVLASDAGGLAEQVRAPGQGGELFRAGDPAALTFALRRMLGRASLTRGIPTVAAGGGWPALVEALEVLVRLIKETRNAC